MAEVIEPVRSVSYDPDEIKAIIRSFGKMADYAVQEAKQESNALAEYAAGKIQTAAQSAPNSKAAVRVAQGVKVSKTSKIGELAFGFASQRFSGGATTQFNYAREGGNGLLAGLEFGSKNYPQFAGRTPRYGQRGNTGYFIFPTMRAIQPDIIARWETAFKRIVSPW
jgi:hypothetical protein